MTNTERPAQRLRIYLTTTDTSGRSSTFERILASAHRLKIRGATVIRGLAGFGTRGNLNPKILRLSESLPLLIEIVDESEKIDALMLDLEDWLQDGLITRESTTIVLHRHSGQAINKHMEGKNI